MALFKKKEEKLPDFNLDDSEFNLPPLPKIKTDLPKFPDLPDFPSYKPSIPEFRPEQSSESSPEVPIRKPSIMEHSLDMDRRAPLFVKISKYKTVISNLNAIKDKIREAENVLAKLDQIKVEEDQQLSAWHSSLSEVKDKLLLIDEKLFEL